MSSINTASSLLSLSSLNINQSSAFTALERLATGRAINRAADNPSGVIAVGNFVARLESIQAEVTVSERNSSNLDIKDATLGASLDTLDDLGALVIQGSSEGGLTSSEFGAIETQINGALAGINSLASSAGIDVLSDVTAEMVVGTDETTGDPITETVSLSDLSRVLETDPAAAQALVDGARDAVLTRRGEIGTEQRAEESDRRVLREEQINIARAASQTRDADYARESSALIRSQVLTQASVYTILAQRQSAQTVLGLLNINA
jgi:flagellin